MRKTKIICTLGPSTDDEQVLRQMMMNGMDAARFNFSHSDHASHKEKFDTVVRLREQLQLPIATILDTKGPEIRLGTFAEKSIVLEPGDTFTPVSYTHLYCIRSLFLPHGSPFYRNAP